MEGADCGDIKHLGSAVVYSQLVPTGEFYPRDVECKMTFKAEDDGWRLMMRVLELDIQDRTVNGFCNDALYVYDDSTILAKALQAEMSLFVLTHLFPPPADTSDTSDPNHQHVSPCPILPHN
ncbi:hypothetical protein ACOMHN_002726 [Nucella lapillus]